MTMAIRILGIDPGLRKTGWGVIASEGTKLSFIGCGCIESDDKRPLAERLKQLHEGIAGVISAFEPDEAAVEETFINRDPQSALKLGQARGIALVVPAIAGLSVAEYAANLVKKTVVGVGHADKKQVQMMIRVLLPKAETRSADAADALAVAICHAQHRGIRTLTAQMRAAS
ncbi:crossover junction endodeoxyribonuclease RuvC [Bosea sp. BK604]|uniref:crossover junction endodeoxyribonuclease RuvC n=1 Tax=Bosea sp. BK604 TaxID=2512180 RepID=UPI00104F554D|nr:crossover junction endodeoxyribonuclease RuvC [Bosea sp. BK604]TCR70230.1 Holliday junction endonuclease RuvC [Bosea sp. BK604]